MPRQALAKAQMMRYVDWCEVAIDVRTAALSHGIKLPLESNSHVRLLTVRLENVHGAVSRCSAAKCEGGVVMVVDSGFVKCA